MRLTPGEIAALIVGGVVLVAVSATNRDAHRNAAVRVCEDRGGVMVQGVGGFVCIDNKVVK